MEVDLDAEVARQRLADDLLLDLAIQRDRDLLALVVLADVDERVLLGELVQRRSQPPAVGGPPRADDRLERRRRELTRSAAAPRRPPRASPTRMSASPATFAISPGDATGRWTGPPGATTRRACTRPSRPSP